MSYYNRTSTEAGCSAGPVSPDDVAVSPARICLNQLVAAQEHSHGLIRELDRRLVAVLRPPVPAKESVGCPSQESLSPLCDALDERASSAFSMNDQLSAIIDRLTI